LFYLFLRRAAGERAALAGCLLLASDPVYLLTTCFDWGPVALQHLLAMAAFVLILRFWHTRSELALVGAFFLAGLAMWDKALTIWTLGGFGLAGLLTEGRAIVARINARGIALTLCAFALGALPLIVYNANTKAATAYDTVAFDIQHMPLKLGVLERTADGSGLFGWLVRDDGTAGKPRRTWMIYAFCAALLLAPIARGPERRAIVFALYATAGAWGFMAVTSGAGDSLHHSILLWPLPQMTIGASFAAASKRLGRPGKPALAAVLILLIGSNLAVLNTYYAATVRNGGAINWSDAIFALSGSLEKIPAREFYCVDWGIMGSLHLLDRGRLPLLVGSDELSRAEWTSADRANLTAMISTPDHVFVTHTPQLEFFPGLTARLVGFAGSLGYRRETLSALSDSHCRPTFEVYRFVRANAR
jgi:hypothetical protein